MLTLELKLDTIDMETVLAYNGIYFFAAFHLDNFTDNTKEYNRKLVERLENGEIIKVRLIEEP